MKPVISIVLIVFNMPRQAINTIYSLSADHQKNVRKDDYEIIVVENSSPNNIRPEELRPINANITYILRDEKGQSPARAINVGIESARGEFIGLMIDGARMASPRILEYTLMAIRGSRNPLVAVPGYNLGDKPQHLHVSNQYGTKKEMELLEKCRWKENGYRLFDIASLGDANANGVMNPMLESNCFFSSKKNFNAIGNAEEKFDLPGGGSLNLHMFRKIGMIEDIDYFVLAGEGTFHQFHGGITTSEVAEREAVLESHRKQLHSFWGGEFHSLRKLPTLLGSITSQAQRYLKYSSRKNIARCKRLTNTGTPLWPDDRENLPA